MSESETPAEKPVPVTEHPGINSHPTRPWARWAAKALDGVIVIAISFVVWIFVGVALAAAELATGNPDYTEWLLATDPRSVALTLIASTIMFAFLLIVFDGMCVWMFGGTPGKALMGIRVAGKNGGTPGFGAAMARAFMMMGLGLGFGIYLLSIVAQVFGFILLKKNGITPWDKWAGVTVETRPVAGWRWVIGIAFVIINRLIAVWDRLASEAPF